MGDGVDFTLPDGDLTEPPEFLEWVIYGYMIFAAVATLLIILSINWEIAKLSFFNFFLLLLDILTDLKMVFVLWVYEDQTSWALMSFFWIWVPFLIHLMKFLFQLCTDCQNAEYMDVVYHIPFIHPFYNAYLIYKLHLMRFGYKDFDYKIS